MPYSKRIFIHIATGKSLIGGIEENKQIFALKNPTKENFMKIRWFDWLVKLNVDVYFNCVRDRNPLGWRGIASSGIVCASMKQNNRSISCIFQIVKHSIDINWTRFRIPITIWTNIFESGSCKDSFMIFCELLLLWFLLRLKTMANNNILPHDGFDR